MSRRTLLILLPAAIILVAAGALAAWILTAKPPGVASGGTTGSTATDGPQIGGPFDLVTTGGETVTEADFAGKPYAIFFGFTYCPDVCPTTLNEMAGWIDALGDKADAMRYAFVTVDPARDDAETMTRYVRAFSDRIVPLTGSEAQIQRVVDAFKIYRAKVPLDDGEDYTMNHTAAVYLMDANGDFVDVISFKDERETAIAKLEQLVSG